VAVEMNKSVAPLKWLATLRRNNYEIDIDTQRCRKDHNQLFLELKRTTDARRAVIDVIWKEEDWDYFQAVITGTDRLQHYLMAAVEDKSHSRHQQAMEYYGNVDRFIKEMWERYHAAAEVSREGEGFYLLSDHGFCLIEQEVNVNAWLREQGYLAFEKDPPGGFEDIGVGSRAFALDPGRIYLHLKGKYPKGGVEPGAEAETLTKEIADKLRSLCYHDRKVLEMVKTNPEAYQGPEAKNGPDLVAVPHHGFDLKASLSTREVFGRSDLTGMHTWDDAFFWSAEKQAPDLEITQLADIVTKTI
jgi:predicted AlkP superfamily phosphohydrolase/phosphomutase